MDRLSPAADTRKQLKSFGRSLHGSEFPALSDHLVAPSVRESAAGWRRVTSSCPEADAQGASLKLGQVALKFLAADIRTRLEGR
jgi:hypothetical protein